MKIALALVIFGIVLIGLCSSDEEELIREKRGRWPAHAPAPPRPERKPGSLTPRGRKPVPARQQQRNPDKWQPPRRLNTNEAGGSPPALPKATARPSARWSPPRKEYRPTVSSSRKTTVKQGSRWTPPRKQDRPWERPPPVKSTTTPPRQQESKPYRPGRPRLPVPIPKDYGTSAIPGKAGKDYPIYYKAPETGFSCTNKIPGYYANVKARCQAFHVCIERIPMKSFLCPNGTVFNQKVFTCDWWNRVRCADSPRYYSLNEEIGKETSVSRRRG